MRVKLDPGAFFPVRAHEDDAGMDLRTPIDIFIKKHTEEYGDGMAVIDTGVHLEIPKGYCGMLVSKSGLNVRNDITNTGLIDAGYTGSIKVKLYNHGSNGTYFKRGDKISQLVIIPCITPELERVDELEDTDRGSGGFGSTGR